MFIVRKVYDELLAGQDDLSDWAKQRKNFFLEPNDATRASLAEVSAWAYSAPSSHPRTGHGTPTQ